MSPTSQQTKKYEKKWDEIVIKMLRAESAKDRSAGADYAKGLQFYFQAAMEFAVQLEHEFQVGQHESERVSSSIHHMHPTMESAAKSVRSGESSHAPFPVHVSKRQAPNKVSTLIDDYEHISMAAVGEENKIDKDSYLTSKPGSSTMKRPSLQLDSNKIPTEFKTKSVSTTPLETVVPKMTVPEWAYNVKKEAVAKSQEIRIEPIILADAKKSTSEILPKTSENVIPIAEPKSEIPSKPIIAAAPVEAPKHYIPEIIKPTPPISEPPKIEPQRKPKRRGACIGAICEDGWRSYSTGRGTCSQHDGVKEWLYEEFSD